MIVRTVTTAPLVHQTVSQTWTLMAMLNVLTCILSMIVAVYARVLRIRLVQSPIAIENISRLRVHQIRRRLHKYHGLVVPSVDMKTAMILSQPFYPNASEVCDGRFNDCNHPLKPDGDNEGVYSGAVGDCFCAVVDTSGDGTADSCDASQCEDSNGNTCTPDDIDSNGYVVDCVIADPASSAFVTTTAGTQLYGAEVECYCPTSDCQLDVTADAVNDCYAPNGSECQALSDSNGLHRIAYPIFHPLLSL